MLQRAKDGNKEPREDALGDKSEIRVRPDPGWRGSGGGELGRVGRAMNRKCTNPPIISNEKEKRKMQFVIPLTGSFLQNVEKLSLTFKTFFF